MAIVHLSGDLRHRVGGHKLLEIDAATVGELVAVIEDQFPAARQAGLRAMAVAIDGEVMPNADYERIGPDSDVYFLAAISGG
jgi:molybdopterin converting factor small subunit